MNKFYFVALLLFVVSLFAQEEELPEITLQVRVEAEKEDIVKVESVKDEAAQKMAGIQNIADVLNRLPGTEGIYGCVLVSPRLSIRSSSFAEREVLVEGINVNPIASCVLDRVPWTSIERVDVLKAPLPPQFIGSLSGVVSVFLKNGNDYPGAYLSTAFGSYNTQIWELSAGGRDERQSYFVAFNRTMGNEWQEKMRTDMSDLSFKLLTGNENEKWTLVGAILQGQQSGFKFSGPNPADRWGHRVPYLQRPGFSLTYEKLFENDAKLQLRIAPVFFRSETHYYWWDQAKQQVLPMQVLLRYNLSRSVINYDFPSSSNGSSSIGMWYQDEKRRGTLPAEEPSIGEWRKQKMRKKGVFFQNVRNLSEKKGLLLGLGYEEVSPGGKAFVTFLSFNWKKGENDLVRVSFGQNKFFPLLEQLYGGGCFIGDPNLKPTFANSFQMDWEKSFQNGKFIATAFYSIQRDVIGNDKDGRYYNIGKVREKGIELSYEKQLGNLFLWSNYTYLDAWDYEHNRIFVSAYRTAEPKHVLKAGATFDDRRGFSYSLELFYWGERATDAGDAAEWWYGAEGGPQQVIVPKKISSTIILNLKISKKLKEGRKISLSLQNLFNRHWQEVLYYPQPGRAVLFELSERF